MLISTIIPVFNAEKTIEVCINSVIKAFSVAKIDEYEIICVNDGSKDDSLSVLQNVTDKNKKLVVVNQENKGAAAARNAGLEIAKGEFIAFNDSDDEWTENHIKDFFDVFNKYSEIDCISATHDIDNQPTFLLKKYNKNEKDLYKVTLNAQQFKNRFSPPTSVFKSVVINNSDFKIRFNEKMKGSEEVFFYNHILKNCNCVLLNKKVSQSILHKLRWGESGLSGNLKAMEKGELFAIKDAYKNLHISFLIFITAYTFSIVKFFRRIFIKRIRSLLK